MKTKTLRRMLIITSDSLCKLLNIFFVIVGDRADPQQPDRAAGSDPLLRGWGQPGQDRDLHRRHSRRWSGREGWSSETRGPDSSGIVITIIVMRSLNVSCRRHYHYVLSFTLVAIFIGLVVLDLVTRISRYLLYDCQLHYHHHHHHHYHYHHHFIHSGVRYQYYCNSHRLHN